MSTEFNDQDNEIDNVKLTILHGFELNRNPILDEEV